MSELYDRVRKEIGSIRIVDIHEHLLAEEVWVAIPEDWTSLLGYAASDLVIAGMSKDELPSLIPMDPRWKTTYGYNVWPIVGRAWEEKWESVKPYWPYVKFIGSGCTVRKTLELFFDCDDLTDETIPAIQKKYKDYKKTSVYREILVERAKMDTVVNVVMSLEECPATNILAPLLYSDQFAAIENREDLYRIERLGNQDIYSLETYVRALDNILEQYVKNGLIGIKWHILAYLRDTNFEISSAYDAAKSLDALLLKPVRGGVGSASSVGFEQMRPFQNYIQHHLIQRAIELGLCIQIHSAHFGSSFGAKVWESKITTLGDLFLRYPQARFDILHAGWPYTRELTSLAFQFENVYINPAWFSQLSIETYKAFFKDWITSIPLNKILGCGPDQFNPLLSYAVVERVRDALAEVFTELVTEGKMSEEDAIFIADTILRRNPCQYFRLDNRHIPGQV